MPRAKVNPTLIKKSKKKVDKPPTNFDKILKKVKGKDRENNVESDNESEIDLFGVEEVDEDVPVVEVAPKKEIKNVVKEVENNQVEIILKRVNEHLEGFRKDFYSQMIEKEKQKELSKLEKAKEREAKRLEREAKKEREKEDLVKTIYSVAKVKEDEVARQKAEAAKLIKQEQERSKLLINRALNINSGMSW